MGWEKHGLHSQDHHSLCLCCLLQEYPVLQLQPYSDVLCKYTSPPAIIPMYEP